MIGVAIIGAGIGAQHLDGFRALPDLFEVRWIIDLDTYRAGALNADTAISKQIEDALEDPGVDVIDVRLPPSLHVPTTLAALHAGKHVICEKPLPTSLADVAQLRKAQTASGCRVFVMLQYRHGPALSALTALREVGLVRTPLVAAIETHWARGPDYYAIPWRGIWQGERGGAELGHAIHADDRLGVHMCAIRAVSGAVATRANAIDTEDCAALSFELEGGAMASSSIPLGAARDETRLRFVYSGLTATSGAEPCVPGQSEWTFTARDPANQDAVDRAIADTPQGHSGFAGAFAEIGKALNGAPHAAVTLEDGATSIELVTAIYDAARSGTRVSQPLPPDHPMRAGWQP